MSNESNVHTIASYNMSFASDLGALLGALMGSEKHFIHDTLERLKALGGDEFKNYQERAAWENAALLVRHFWMNETNASAMGLQEMNTSSILKSKFPLFQGGDDRLKKILEDLDLGFYSKNVEGRFGSFPTLVTIWKKEKLGELTHDYIADLGLDGEFKGDTVNKGRPISIIHTTKGFTLINLHSPNVSAQSHTYGMQELRKAINTHISRFVRRHNIRLDPTKLFVMGDFNDPFNAINRENPLVIDRTRSPLYYNTVADGTKKVKSCCYNFDSACPSNDRNPMKKRVNKNVLGDDIINNQGYQIMADEYECFIRESDDPAINQRISPGAIKTNASDELDGKLIQGLSIGKRGHLANYQYTGDYVMGVDVEESLQIYRPATFSQKVSLESDHEMVYATFRSGVSGGRRKRHTRHKKHHKQRRTYRKKRHTRRK